MPKNSLIAGGLAALLAYSIGWITISKQDPVPGLDQLSAVLLTLAIFLLAFSYFKRNPL